MAWEPKPMTGSMFKSRSTHPKAPVMSGDLYLQDGTKLRVSAWWATDRETGAKRKDRDGHPWLNLKLEEDDGGRQASSGNQAAASQDDDEIPF